MKCIRDVQYKIILPSVAEILIRIIIYLMLSTGEYETVKSTSSIVYEPSAQVLEYTSY